MQVNSSSPGARAQVTFTPKFLHAANMTHQNLDTKRTREIRFSCPPFLVTAQNWSVRTTTSKDNQTYSKTSLPELHISQAGTTEGTCAQSSDLLTTHIEVEYDNYWWVLPAKVAQVVFEGMCSGHSKFLYSYKYIDKQGTWRQNGELTNTSRYIVDTYRMTHKNRDTEYNRRIRFCVGPFLLTKQGWSFRTLGDTMAPDIQE